MNWIDRLLRLTFFLPRNRKAFLRTRYPISFENIQEDYLLTYSDVRRYFSISAVLSSVYSLFSNSANRLYVRLLLNDEELQTYTDNLNKDLGYAFADWLLFGVTFMHKDLRYADEADNDFQVENKKCVSYSAKKLFETIIHLERAEKQLAERLGANVVMMPTDPARPLAESEIRALRELINEKRKYAGAGGIEPLAFAVSFQEIPVDYNKYNMTQNWSRVFRLLSALYAFDSSILNDPDNKTYSNKELALVSFYSDTIIPAVQAFIDDLLLSWNAHRIQNGEGFLDVKSEVDSTRVDILSYYKLQKADTAIKLFEAGLIDREEARRMVL